jgi:hypothetical protein
MDGGEAQAAVEVEASAPPAVFQLALWLPAFFVVLWFVLRLFRGRWVHEQASRRGSRMDPPPRA